VVLLLVCLHAMAVSTQCLQVGGFVVVLVTVDVIHI